MKTITTQQWKGFIASTWPFSGTVSYQNNKQRRKAGRMLRAKLKAGKAILTTLLASTIMVGATTITINDDTPTELDFSINWGARIDEASVHATGEGGSVIHWLAQTSRNRNYYWVEIDDRWFPEVQGFGLRFWADPEYYGPVNTALTALPMILEKFVLPIETTPYGARFIYRHEPVVVQRGIASAVPDTGHAWALMALGLAGVALAKRLEHP